MTFHIAGFTEIANDHAYVEAESEADAKAKLQETLDDLGVAEDVRPQTEWRVKQVERPVVILHWQD